MRYRYRQCSSALFPILVVDDAGEPFLPVTLWAQQVADALSPSTVRTYLAVLLPFFGWLKTDQWRLEDGSDWAAEPMRLRVYIEDYLSSKSNATVRSDGNSGKWVTADSRSATRSRQLLAALKSFYGIMIKKGLYHHNSPLTDVHRQDLNRQAELRRRSSFERMPSFSGVEPPRKMIRLTDNYFKLVAGTWQPKVINDPSLMATMLTAGAQRNWNLREEIITRLLFETGARIGEICSLSLFDWHSGSDFKESASSKNKGSGNARVKSVQWRPETTALLIRYINNQRRSHCPYRMSFSDLTACASRKDMSRMSQPLFLSSRGGPYSSNLYRSYYWKQICAQAQVVTDPHQIRHWFVSMVLSEIRSRSAHPGDLESSKQALLQYMHWSSGEEMITVYEHANNLAQHHDVVANMMKDLSVKRPRKGTNINNEKARITMTKEKVVRGLGLLEQMWGTDE